MVDTLMNKHAFIFYILVACFSVNSLYGAEYTGKAICESCHENEYQQWQDSDHDKSMQLASIDSVMGDFSNVSVRFHNINSRFYKSGDQFMVDTLDRSNVPASFRIDFAFGHYPLQQYLVETEDGHIQALNIAWDSRPSEDGGQRWFHLQPNEEITPEHPFFWTNHFQNWNSRCAECHSTNLQRNFSVENSSYDTQWSEINIACEGCHGPASDHVAMAQAGSFNDEMVGFATDLSDLSLFTFSSNTPIAINQGAESTGQLNTCATCHSRRGTVSTNEPGQDYHENFQLSLLDRGLYFADGQIDDEVFVFGSFLQSKMHGAGVTCTNCHNPHTTELKLTGNGLCLQCHIPANYQTIDHHQHEVSSSGAQCIGCHMPERTYMQVDDRRDHSFSIPRPSLANRIGAPNACSNCHQDWNESEIVTQYEALFGEEPISAWAEANFEANRLNVLALPELLAVANDATISPIQRASLISQLANYPARITLQSIEINLQDSDPLVRRAAVEAIAFIPPQGRLQILDPLIEDPVKSVRVAVANQLADAFAFADESDIDRLLSIYDEYEDSLMLNQDTPGAQINLGGFFYRRGNPIGAERAYQKALEIEPAFVPALLNLAELRRAEGNNAEVQRLLLLALNVASDSGAAHHSLGLHYVRIQELELALFELELATEMIDSTARYSYVYAVALDSVGDRDAAINVLKASNLRWPNQPESLLVLVNYLDQESRGIELLPYLSSLSRLIPSDPNVAALVNKYAGGN